MMLSDIFMLIESVNSVALEHDDDCSCLACRAADGNEEAMSAIVLALQASRKGQH